MAATFPTPQEDDAEDVHWALSTASALWGRGERAEALKWLRRAAENASDANADTRALDLFKAAADLTGTAAADPAPKPASVPAPAPTPAAPPVAQKTPSSAPPSSVPQRGTVPSGVPVPPAPRVPAVPAAPVRMSQLPNPNANARTAPSAGMAGIDRASLLPRGPAAILPPTGPRASFSPEPKKPEPPKRARSKTDPGSKRKSVPPLADAAAPTSPMAASVPAAPRRPPTAPARPSLDALSSRRSAQAPATVAMAKPAFDDLEDETRVLPERGDDVEQTVLDDAGDRMASVAVPSTERAYRITPLPAVRVAVVAVGNEARIVALDGVTTPPAGAARAILVPLTEADADAVLKLIGAG